MKKKHVTGLIAVLAIVMSAAFFAGCSSFPTAQVRNNIEMSYEVLGYVGPDFASYDEAFTAARATFSNANAVIRVRGRLDDNLIPARSFFGYYAIRFIPVEKEPKKGLIQRIFNK